ncbi:MAG: 2-C-methyl-D-erythritol 2,4-cyclodiphosphate synthase [Candidatus Gracilibacteria bacterium]
MKSKTIAIILAAGKSLRMQGVDKIETEVLGKPLIVYTVAPFLMSKMINEVVIACNKDNKKFLQKTFPSKKFPHVHLSLGGETRFDSAKKAFRFAEKKFNLNKNSVVIYHNSGNVLVTQKEIEKTIAEAKKTGACIVAREASDTLKRVNKKSKKYVSETIDRSEIIHAETPQTFRYDIIKSAYKIPIKTTDEALLVEKNGGKISWTAASTFNRKITTQHDLEYTKYLIEKSLAKNNSIQKESVCGIGTDAHYFDTASKKPLILCGTKVLKLPKLKGNSDADVALHALATAISQAIGGGSLGTFSDPMCEKGITDSRQYVKYILDEASEKKMNIIHIGLHFECLSPAIDPLAKAFRSSLSKLTKLDEARIGITATSGEKSTPWAQGEGIHCAAIVTMSLPKK